MCGILCGNCCVVLSCGNGQKNHRNVQKYHRNGQKNPQEWAKNAGILCGISYGTLIAVWYCLAVMGKKPQEWAKKHRNCMWMSYRTLIAVWYCPVVMGKKPTGIVCGFPIVH